MKTLASLLSGLLVLAACSSSPSSKTSSNGGGGGSSPSNGSGGTCSVTLSGAVTSTLDCLDQLNVQPQSPGSTAPTVSLFNVAADGLFTFDLEGVTVAKGSYMTGNTHVWAHGGVKNRSASGVEWWNLDENDATNIPNVGSYNLQVTAVATAPANVSTAVGTVQVWPIEGMFDGTYAADPSTGATGTVTVHVDFHDKSMR